MLLLLGREDSLLCVWYYDTGGVHSYSGKFSSEKQSESKTLSRAVVEIFVHSQR